MPWQGSPPNQSTTRTTGLQTGSTSWAATEASSRGIESSDHDTHDQDVADMINAALKKDGGNTMTGNISAGGFGFTNLRTPSSSGDSATKGYVDGVVTQTVNVAVRIASTTAITKATAMDNGKTMDGTTLATNDRVLLKDQSSASENGVWVVAASGAPTRATDYDAWAEVLNTIVNVSAGSANAGKSYRCTVNAGGTVDSTSITYQQYGTTLTTPVGISSGGTGATDAASAFTALKQAGTTSVTGVLQLATNNETTTGIDTAKATTAAGVAAAIAAAVPIAQNSKSAAYTTVLTDAGKHILHPSADTTARTWTIDSNANVAYSIGTAIIFVNQHGAGTITIAITSDTMRLAVSGTTGNRTLAADGVATALKITSTEWIISGSGLT